LGFTLPEMLIVVGIIGLLVAILLPTLGGIRKHSRFVECAAKLRIIGNACRMEATHRDGYMPLIGRIVAPPTSSPADWSAGVEDPDRRRYMWASVPNNGGQSPVPFIAALAPHLGVNNLPRSDWNVLDQALNDRNGVWPKFICPDTESIENAKYNNDPNDKNVVGQGTMMVCVVRSTISAWAHNSDYAANEGVFGYHYDNAFRRNRLGGNISMIKRPESVVLFGDAIPRKAAADPIMPLGWITWTPALNATGAVTMADALASNSNAQSSENFALNRHGKRMNVVFVDGHVEARAIDTNSLSDVYLVAP
jgi:prepilin-type processing-associated H-X9-DG protein/prepilin-type N-terminal cleavage/methylation domain-containing protein